MGTKDFLLPATMTIVFLTGNCYYDNKEPTITVEHQWRSYMGVGWGGNPSRKILAILSENMTLCQKFFTPRMLTSDKIYFLSKVVCFRLFVHIYGSPYVYMYSPVRNRRPPTDYFFSKNAYHDILIATPPFINFEHKRNCPTQT